MGCVIALLLIIACAVAWPLLLALAAGGVALVAYAWPLILLALIGAACWKGAERRDRP